MHEFTPKPEGFFRCWFDVSLLLFGEPDHSSTCRASFCNFDDLVIYYNSEK